LAQHGHGYRGLDADDGGAPGGGQELDQDTAVYQERLADAALKDEHWSLRADEFSADDLGRRDFLLDLDDAAGVRRSRCPQPHLHSVNLSVVVNRCGVIAIGALSPVTRL